MSDAAGTNLSTIWRDDAQPTLDQLWAEVESRFGICPSFFKLAQPAPPIAWHLFRMAEFTYLDNPMPAHFKEKLFTWLSRFCEVRYCVSRHCAFLLGHGHVAGDAGAPSLDVEQALALLNELMPGKEELPEYLSALEKTDAPLNDWPDFDSNLGRRFRVACAVVFLDPGHAGAWLHAMRGLLGARRYEQLMLFLAFVRIAHFWTQVHPELAFEPDLEALLREHEALAEPLLRGAGESQRWELGQRLYDELQALRESQTAAETLRKNDERFRATFENAAVGIAHVSPDGHWLEVNQRLCDIVGYSREELMTKTFGDITHADDLEADWKLARRLLTAGEIEHGSIEKRYYHRNGSIVRINLTVSLVRKADGSPDYFICIVEDISARKWAEEKLRESEERFRLLADTAPVLIWTSGVDKLCTFFNKPWLDFTGRTMEQELGYGWTEGVHTEDYARCLETYVTSFEVREPFKMEYRLRRYDGEYRWLLDHGIPRFSSSGQFLGYIGSCIDITERKQAEAERELLAQEQAARTAAEAATRAKDEFLAIVSHELRSPLTAILGYTRMLSSGPVDKDAINKVTSVVERNTKAQLQIIEDLLDSARIISGKLRIEPGPVDMVSVLESALDTVRPAAEAMGVTLLADFGPRVEMFGDSTRLQQVMWNLLVNAVKFTPKGGRVELRLESDADNVRIRVSDTGKGIEPEFLPFVFDRFRQADTSSVRRHGGLGLGLSLVKHLVELHGGVITAASEGAGRGATFTVELPRGPHEFVALSAPAVASREARTEGAIPMDKTVSLKGVSVLVVDDQEEARGVLTQALGEYGAEVTALSSGVEALALLSEPPRGRRPDVLILDIAMPGEDGYTVLKKVRALRALADQIPAIALTACGRSEDRLRALQAGFNIHVAKPVDPTELAVVIAHMTTTRPLHET